MNFRMTTINSTYFQAEFFGRAVSFNYGYFMIRYFDCDGINFMLNKTDNTCNDICPDGQYYNFTTMVCTDCRFDCLTCYVESGDQCMSCPANR